MEENYTIILELLKGVIPNFKGDLKNVIVDYLDEQDVAVLAEKIDQKKKESRDHLDLINSLTQEREKLSIKLKDLEANVEIQKERNKRQIKIESVLELFPVNNEQTDWNNKLFELLNDSVIKKKELIKMSLAYATYSNRLQEIVFRDESELEFVNKCEKELENFLMDIHELNDLEARRYILVKVEANLNEQLKIYEFIAPERNLNFDNNMHEAENQAFSSRFKKSKSFCIRNKENGSIYRKANVIT